MSKPSKDEIGLPPKTAKLHLTHTERNEWREGERQNMAILPAWVNCSALVMQCIRHKNT